MLRMFPHSQRLLVAELIGAENFCESHHEQLRWLKQALKPTALVQFSKKSQNRYLNENPLFIGVSRVFCTSKVAESDCRTT